MELQNKKKKHKPSAVMVMHYIILTYRTVLFSVFLAVWILDFAHQGKPIMYYVERYKVIFLLLWLVFAVEMVFRFFPSRIKSPGCQKQFESNYIKTGKTEIVIPDNHATVMVALLWIIFNAVFGALHMLGFLGDGFMLLLCCFYSVCDMICILFFCPFQSWFFKNRCCSTCRIYNWDYAMMFTPLFFVPRLYTWSLLALAVFLLLRWEMAFYLHPERFSENTNAYLQCANCTEKLCRHKKQLAPLWQSIDRFTRARIQRLKRDK